MHIYGPRCYRHPCHFQKRAQGGGSQRFCGRSGPEVPPQNTKAADEQKVIATSDAVEHKKSVSPPPTQKVQTIVATDDTADQKKSSSLPSPQVVTVEKVEFPVERGVDAQKTDAASQQKQTVALPAVEEVATTQTPVSLEKRNATQASIGFSSSTDDAPPQATRAAKRKAPGKNRRTKQRKTSLMPHATNPRKALAVSSTARGRSTVTKTQTKPSRRVTLPHVPTSDSECAYTGEDDHGSGGDDASDKEESSEASSDESTDVATQASDPFADLPSHETPFDLPPDLQFLEEKKPRERKSAFSTTREKIAVAHAGVPKHAEALLRKGYRPWDQVTKALEYYGVTTGYRFRIRSSQPVAKCKGPDGIPIPEKFKHGFKNYRCIHGVMQASRGGGTRDAKLNFTDCKARFDAVVSKVTTEGAGSTWCILLKNEWREHNHCKDKGRRVRGVNDVPYEGPVADSIAVLADVGTGSRQIASYASGRRVSSQVIRNVLRRLQQNSTAQARLKNLLHTLKQIDGSKVLVIQDDLDITGGIVIQTRVQKLAFTQ
ncbi:hypothetical protein V7S43_007576 [Phytophthora oleae]|uniref:Uncharacterized protein n=1 Tax=Phytophthora oleae TaxID=2107226 RepID=A0ABD3FKB8_9STRA